MGHRNRKFLYADLADRIQTQIEKGAFRLSEKLPSLRALCQQTGYSMTTVFQAYIELEKRGVVEPRQRSGYYIKARASKISRLPNAAPRKMVPRKVTIDSLIHELTEDMGNPDILKLGGIAVSPEHLPAVRLFKHLKSIPANQIHGVMSGYVHPQGDALLRDQITNLLFGLIPSVSMEDIIITNGCTEALNLSMKAVARPGDTIMIESPTDPWLRQTIKNSNIFALEIPTDPLTGMDLDSIENAINTQKISACMINPNCQNPLGFIMPDSHKKRLLKLLEEKDIPIIENDIAGELYFGKSRPLPIKTWDTKGNVIYCSSFSKVLTPGLRVGWVVPGRFKDSIKKMKLNRSMISPTLNQVIVARYLKEGGFPRHLRKLRKILKLQYSYCHAAIVRHFPDTIKTNAPKGGLSIWIELPRHIKGSQVYAEAKKQSISILPGYLCSGHDTFDHFIRIGYGGLWDKTLETAIEQVGDMVKKLNGAK